jgi:hypothetical protein
MKKERWLIRNEKKRDGEWGVCIDNGVMCRSLGVRNNEQN